MVHVKKKKKEEEEEKESGRRPCMHFLNLIDCVFGCVWWFVVLNVCFSNSFCL